MTMLENDASRWPLSS